MNSRIRARSSTVAVAVLLSLATAGCAGRAGSPTPSASSASTASTVALTRDVRCELDGTTVELRIPAAYDTAVPQEDSFDDTPQRCEWRDPDALDEDDQGPDPSILVAAATRDDSLARFHEDLAGDVGVGGDDDIEELRLDSGVPIFPGAIGDRLAYYAFYDGDPRNDVRGPASGVELEIVVPALGRGDDPATPQQLREQESARALFDAIAGTVRISSPSPSPSP